MKGDHSLPDLLTRLGIEFKAVGAGGGSRFGEIAPVGDATSTSLVFIDRPGPGTLAQVKESPCTVFLLRREWGESNEKALQGIGKGIFLVAQPRLAAGRLLGVLHPEEDAVEAGVHPSAIVDPRATIEGGVSIGPFCVIGPCVIREGSRIAAFVRIREGVEIGRGVIVREHCFLGSPGFGIVRDEGTGGLLRIPHVGRAVLEDGVEIFPFANVDRGTLTETRIRRGAKIDHYVHVAHNVVVGEDAIVTASSVLCGSSRIGARAWIGVGTLVKEGVTVGDDAMTGLGAVVIRDVPPGEVVAGVPARALRSRGTASGSDPG